MEHRLLLEIAVLADKFMPIIEQTHAPVTRRYDFEMLRARLHDLRTVRSSQAGAGETIVELGEILRDLSNG